jgi:tripartite-type tricarboxylate transporter receptor subunit TctC
MKMNSRSLLSKMGVVFVSFALCLGLTGSADAQGKYPTREITMILSSPAGTSTDLCARALVTAASKILSQNIIVLNKPGAAQSIQLVAVKTAKPDGYTLALLESGGASAQLLKPVPYDYLKDFTYIMQAFGYQHGIVVQTGAQWKTIQELVAYAKNNPGKLRMGVLGVGSGHHLAAERLAVKAGVKFNIVPFGDSVTALTNLLGGHVDAACSASTFIPYVESGQMRILAVAGGAEKRIPQYPDVPTLMETYGFGMPSFPAVGGPKGIPAPIVEILHQAFKKAMADPEFVKTNEKFATPLVYRNPEETTKYVQDFFAELGPVVKQLGLRKE